MRRGVELRYAGQRGAGEVCEVGAQAAALERGLHGCFIDDLLASEVQQHGTRAKAGQRLGVDQASVLRHGGNVQSHVVGASEQRRHARHAAHVARQTPGRLHGQLRIVADHLHAKTQRGLCNPRADRAEAEDAERPGRLPRGP